MTGRGGGCDDPPPPTPPPPPDDEGDAGCGGCCTSGCCCCFCSNSRAPDRSIITQVAYRTGLSDIACTAAVATVVAVVVVVVVVVVVFDDVVVVDVAAATVADVAAVVVTVCVSNDDDDDDEIVEREEGDKEEEGVEEGDRGLLSMRQKRAMSEPKNQAGPCPGTRWMCWSAQVRPLIPIHAGSSSFRCPVDVFVVAVLVLVLLAVVVGVGVVIVDNIVAAAVLLANRSGGGTPIPTASKSPTKGYLMAPCLCWSPKT